MQCKTCAKPMDAVIVRDSRKKKWVCKPCGKVEDRHPHLHPEPVKVKLIKERH
jgi:translation initiation factor 2 beta subunit (eIF-2beta)/eIF-5